MNLPELVGAVALAVVVMEEVSGSAGSLPLTIRDTFGGTWTSSKHDNVKDKVEN